MNGLPKAGSVVSTNWFFTHLAGRCLKMTGAWGRTHGSAKVAQGRVQGTSVGISKLGCRPNL